jgi:hypothetical protein
MEFFRHDSYENLFPKELRNRPTMDGYDMKRRNKLNKKFSSNKVIQFFDIP